MGDRDKALKRISRLIEMAGQLLSDAKEIADENDLSFTSRDKLPFEIKYVSGPETWKVGTNEYWEDSGCTIGVEDLDDWISSSAHC